MTNNNEPNCEPNNEHHETLTAFLAAHKDVAYEVWRELPEGLKPEWDGGTEQDATNITCSVLDELPDAHFSSALARVADVMKTTLLIDWGISCDGARWATCIPLLELGLYNHYRVGKTLREALQALWLALLTLAVEECGECWVPGLKRIQREVTYDENGNPDGSLIYCDTCPHCNGTGRKHPALLDALIGGNDVV